MPYEIYMNIGNYQGKDFSKYEVSNLGNVRNAKTKRVLKSRLNATGSGYIKVIIDLQDTNHKRHTVAVARLVLSTFKANPRNCSDVNHINEDPSDNRLNNLEWMSHRDNCNYGTRNERSVATRKANGTYDKISDKLSKPVYCITNNTVYKSACEAARQLNLNQGGISMCLKGKSTHAGGYQFEYYTEGDAE